MSYFKVVLSKSVAEVAQNVIKYVRLPLLTPEELKQVEVDNEKDRMIPVSFGLNITPQSLNVKSVISTDLCAKLLLDSL